MDSARSGREDPGQRHRDQLRTLACFLPALDPGKGVDVRYPRHASCVSCHSSPTREPRPGRKNLASASMSFHTSSGGL
jgi:hypothetical protein